MSGPFVIVQISDPHIGGDWAEGRDSVSLLAATVRSIRTSETRFDAVLVTGDLADHAADAEYVQIRELLAPLETPLYVLPGNHDDRGALRRHFDVPGANGEPVQYAVNLGPLRLVVLDTTRPGEDPGELDTARLTWLDEALNDAPTTPTVIAVHHTPLFTGIVELDEAGLARADQDALGQVIERHPQIVRIVGGHIHRTMVGDLGSRPVFAAPSTYVQGLFAFGSNEIELTDEPPGFTVHSWVDDRLISLVHPVGHRPIPEL